MLLFEVICLLLGALEIEFFKLYFLQPVLGSHPVLTLSCASSWEGKGR